MKQSQIAWKLLLAAGLTFQLGCTADGADPIQILRNQVPGADCVIPTDSAGAFLSRGIIDVNSTGGYLFTPLVLSDAEANEVAARRFFAEGADVDIEFVGANIPTVSGGLESSISFRTLISGSIDASATSTFAFEIVSPALLADLVDDVTPTNPVQLVASVKLVGNLEGNDVESNTFNYPVEVCSGCLTNVIGACEGLEETDISSGGACNPAQDGITDCCTAPDGSLTCPAVPIIAP